MVNADRVAVIHVDDAEGVTRQGRIRRVSYRSRRILPHQGPLSISRHMRNRVTWNCASCEEIVVSMGNDIPQLAVTDTCCFLMNGVSGIGLNPKPLRCELAE